jgi:hypothetical protein
VDGAAALGQAFNDLIRDTIWAVKHVLRIVFSLTFPLLLITLCGVSFVLHRAFGLPEFSLWESFATAVLEYARTEIWAIAALGLFGLAALPLAWVAYREQEVTLSAMIANWVFAAMLIGSMVWLRTAWPYEQDGGQVLVYGIAMFAAWSFVLTAALATLRIVVHARQNRPVPTQPPEQEPHGGAAAPRQRAADPETI